jgi:hypothetical protein
VQPHLHLHSTYLHELSPPPPFITPGALSASSITATSGPSSFTGGINNNFGGITNVGIITGLSNLSVSGKQ